MVHVHCPKLGDHIGVLNIAYGPKMVFLATNHCTLSFTSTEDEIADHVWWVKPIKKRGQRINNGFESVIQHQNPDIRSRTAGNLVTHNIDDAAGREDSNGSKATNLQTHLADVPPEKMPADSTFDKAGAGTRDGFDILEDFRFQQHSNGQL